MSERSRSSRPRRHRPRAWPPGRWPVWVQVVAVLAVVATVHYLPGAWSIAPSVLVLTIVFTGRGSSLPPDPVVRWAPGVDFATAAALLAGPERELVHLDGRGVRDAADLARVLDVALGAIQHPVEPLPRVLAHVGLEARGVGRKVLVFTQAGELAEREPATFAAFVTAWEERMAASPWSERLLIVDRPQPAQTSSGNGRS